MTLGERVVWEGGRWLGISAYHRSPGIALYGGTQVEDLLYYIKPLYYTLALYGGSKLSGQRLRIFSGKRSCGRA